MKLIVDLSNKADVLEAIVMLRTAAGLDNGTPATPAAPAPVQATAEPTKPKEKKAVPAPVVAAPAPLTTPAGIVYPPGTEALARDPKALVESRVQPAPAVMKEVTIPDIQAVIKEHLKKFPAGSKELMDERNNMIEILRETANVGSSVDIPDDRLSDTFVAINQYINTREA